MKKILCLMIATLMLTTAAAGAFADEGSAPNALDAFFALTGESADAPAKSSEQYLQEIVAGAYTVPADNTAETLASELKSLSGITHRDLAAYASSNALTVAQVRNAYYRALADVLEAEMAVNPAMDERDQNIQLILSLFLDEAAVDENSTASRQAIRSSMTPEYANVIAGDYSLPSEFVEFIIMDDDWDDDLWENDDDWKASIDWDSDPYVDSADDIAIGSRDGASSTRVADMQAKLIELGYLNSKADGRFGEKTEAALKQFQRANGLPATGVYDDDDDDRLASADAVARWDYGDSFYSTPDDSPVRSNSSGSSSSSRSNSPDNSPQYSPQNSPQNSPQSSGSPDNS